MVEQAVTRMASESAALLRQVKHPERPILGIWNTGELAVHMLHVFDFELDVAHRRPLESIQNFDELSRYTTAYVRDEPSRDPAEIAERMEARAAEFVAVTAGEAPDALYDWLGGSKLPQSALHAHILSECQVHGWDVARSEGLDWEMRPTDAVAAVDGFVVPLAGALAQSGGFGGQSAFVDQEKAKGLRACYEVRVVGAPPRHFVFDDGSLTISDPGDRRVDCYVRADPVALNLIAWGRRSPWPSVATGRLRAWGRKPWLAARLTSLLATP